MKNEIAGFTNLASNPLPGTLTQSGYGRRIHAVLVALEANIMSSNQDKVLLLIENDLMKDLSMISIERFLRYTHCERILLLVPSKGKTKMVETWRHAVSWENGCKLAEQFSTNFMPQNKLETQICISTVFDIQVHMGVDPTLPFFKAFDAIVIYDVPSHPGPAWNQIVDQFAASGTCVIGLSSTLSEDEGKLLFGCVVDTKSTSEYKH